MSAPGPDNPVVEVLDVRSVHFLADGILETRCVVKLKDGTVMEMSLPGHYTAQQRAAVTENLGPFSIHRDE